MRNCKDDNWNNEVCLLLMLFQNPKQVVSMQNLHLHLSQCALETAGSSSSQDISDSDGELVDEETSDTVTEADAVTEADDVITEDVVEVVNLDFSDETIANTAAEESNYLSNDINTPSGSSTILLVVDQESLHGSNASVNQAVGTEDSVESRLKLLEQLRHQQWLYSLVKAELDAKIISTSPSRMLENDDKRMHYFTGLSSYSVFTTLLELLSQATKPYLHFGSSPGDQLLMVLTKLRHADPHQHLGYQFGVDITRVSKIFNHSMNIMYVELQPLIRWPERDMLRKTLPACFKPQYSRATCIIDRSEIFIQ